MSVYLKDIPLKTAIDTFRKAMAEAGWGEKLSTEIIPLDENALGRTLSEPVWAKISSPHYHSSAMDGFAVTADSTRTALPSAPLSLKVDSQAIYVDTGDPLPLSMNAVIPIENVEPLNPDGSAATEIRKPAYIRIRASVTPWSVIRLMGEDIIATQMVLPAGHILRPVDLGAIAACGHQSLCVVRKPTVAVIPTGTELIPVGKKIEAGSIIEFNSIVLASMVNNWGGFARRYPIVMDDYNLIREAILHAATESDLILLNAGSSAGSEDFSSRLVEENGILLVHGVAVRPGHPVILGLIRHPINKEKLIPIIGVPGYPVSAALTGEIFVRPVIEQWLGNLPKSFISIQAKLTHKVNSPAGDDDYLRVVAGRVGKDLLAAPLPRGAGVINSLVKADGIVIIPRGEQGIEAGSMVNVHLYNRPEELEKTIFLSGSHDLSLDILADEVSHKNIRIVTSNVGSIGGLVSLRRAEAHGAGSHLLDPETGEYNLSYIQKYCPDLKINVFHWVERVQGLIVPKGNPKKITSILEIARSEVSFVNRQRGAGTRVLLDYQLVKNKIDPSQITGYNQEEYTHLAVAAAVSSGRADCGLGIAAAARALDLDFVPLFNETYELLVPEDFLKLQLMEVLLESAQQSSFRKRVESMPGYKASKCGELRTTVG